MKAELPASIIKRGLESAASDFVSIAEIGQFAGKRRFDSHIFDVKPKEDQVKCALYRAFVDDGYLVHVEAGYITPYDTGRCDLIAVKDDYRIAIEIKTAWAGGGWVNKSEEQARSWHRDVSKIETLIMEKLIDSGVFVLCFIYECACTAEYLIRDKISEIFKAESDPLIQEVILNHWNGLNRMEFFVLNVMPSDAT